MSRLRRFPARTGVATLVRRAALTPRMIRVTLAQRRVRRDWPIEQPGEIITLLFPLAGEEIVLPLQGWDFPPGAPSRSGATTPCAATIADAGEIDVDVVLHEPRGPACTWAPSGCRSAGRRRLRRPAGRLRAARRRGLAAAVRRRDGAARDRRDPGARRRRGARRRGHRGRRRGRGAAARAATCAGCTATAPPRRRRRTSPTRCARSPLPDGPGQAWGAAESQVARTCARSCATSAGCRASTQARRATGCARASGSSRRTDAPRRARCVPPHPAAPCASLSPRRGPPTRPPERGVGAARGDSAAWVPVLDHAAVARARRSGRRARPA